MARLEDLKVPRISLMTFPEVLEHIKEVRFRRRTEPKSHRVRKEKPIKVSKLITPESLVEQMSLEDIQKFLQIKGKK